MSLLLGLCLLGGVLVAGMAFPGALALGLVAGAAGDSVNSVSTDLLTGQVPTASTITDSAGAPIAYLFDQNREPVPADQISPAMKAAIVAVEDRRFYQHQGVDWQGTIRALVANSASGGVVQGASTLTQQYVKNYLLYVQARTEAERLKATEQTPARKLREARIALQMERSLSKEDILARYLNIVFWGNGAYGVSAAARTYFNTTADQLTVAQAALLAGMVRSTSQFDPVANPAAALDRRNLVIIQMQEQGMIDASQAQQALAQPLGIANPLGARRNGCIGAGDAGFFCKYVTDYLAEAGVPMTQILRGGYTIKTTLDRDAMEKMKASLNAEVPADAANVADVMAIVAPGQDHHRVLAMGSSRTFGLDAGKQETSYGLPYEPVNLGAGSVYKIFTTATAMEKGVGINYVMVVPPSGYASPIYVDGNGRPIPVNNAGNYADRLSDHRCVGAVAEHGVHQARGVHRGARRGRHGGAVGHEVVGHHPVHRPEQRAAHRPVDRRGHQGPEAGLLHPRVSPDQRAGAGQRRGDAGRGGKWCPPSPIESVTDANGQPVSVTEAPCNQAVEPGLANTLLTALSKDDVPGGTSAAAAAQAGWNRPVAGKTGTTQQHKSAAFIGIVPQLSGAVITFDNSNSPRPLCDGAGAAVPLPRGQHLRRQDPRRDLVRRDETAAGGPARAGAAADRPPLHRGGRRVPRPGRGGPG